MNWPLIIVGVIGVGLPLFAIFAICAFPPEDR